MMSSCELLPGPFSLHRGPAYPKIVYHNQQWTSHPSNDHHQWPSTSSHQWPTASGEWAGGSQWVNTTYPSGDHWIRTAHSSASFAHLERRHTLDNINFAAQQKEAEEEKGQSRKRQKLVRPSNSFKRKSMLFFKLLGSERKDKKEQRYEIKCSRDNIAPSPHVSIRSTASEPVHTSTPIVPATVHRTVSDSTETVTLRRATKSIRTSGSRPLTMDVSSSTSHSFRFSEDLPPRPLSKRPSSCYVKSPSREPDQVSGFQRKLRRFSSSVKNFSLEKIMNQRKLSGPLKEETVTDSSEQSSSSSSTRQRKSLPSDFKFENGVRCSTPKSSSRQVGCNFVCVRLSVSQERQCDRYNWYTGRDDPCLYNISAPREVLNLHHKTNQRYRFNAMSVAQSCKNRL